MNLFDLAESQQLKDDGMGAAAAAKGSLLAAARRIAIELALADPLRQMDADRVGQAMVDRGMGELGPAAGSIFKGKGKLWRFTGKRILSVRVSNHRREIKVWELK